MMKIRIKAISQKLLVLNSLTIMIRAINETKILRKI
jgi:hypothetical protein